MVLYSIGGKARFALEGIEIKKSSEVFNSA